MIRFVPVNIMEEDHNSLENLMNIIDITVGYGEEEEMKEIEDPEDRDLEDVD